MIKFEMNLKKQIACLWIWVTLSLTWLKVLFSNMEKYPHVVGNNWSLSIICCNSLTNPQEHNDCKKHKSILQDTGLLNNHYILDYLNKEHDIVVWST
jgi:hypothetical protein